MSNTLYNMVVKLQKENTELKKDVEIDAREINAVHNELARKVDEIKELQIKLRNCVSPDVLSYTEDTFNSIIRAKDKDIKKLKEKLKTQAKDIFDKMESKFNLDRNVACIYDFSVKDYLQIKKGFVK